LSHIIPKNSILVDGGTALHVPLLGFGMLNYLDDFADVESPSRAKKAFDELKHLLDSCGLEESSHKAVPPSTRMEFLGIDWPYTSLS
jgi:hypothetical protein